MKTIKFTVYLLYKYYSKGGTKDIPYASAICALTLMGVIHIYQILLLFNKMTLVPTDGSQAKIGNFLKMGLFMLPVALFLIFVAKKSELEQVDYTTAQIKRGYTFLILYVVLSFALLLLLIFYKKGNFF